MTHYEFNSSGVCRTRGNQSELTRNNAGKHSSLVLACIASLIASVPVASAAQEMTKNPLGFETSDRNMVDPVGGARDARGNLIKATIDDVDTGGSLSCGVGASAFGNLISVVIDGNGNSVKIDATQTNNGDISAYSDLNTGGVPGC